MKLRKTQEKNKNYIKLGKAKEKEQEIYETGKT
jgi:hypothetical protein